MTLNLLMPFTGYLIGKLGCRRIILTAGFPVRDKESQIAMFTIFSITRGDVFGGIIGLSG